MKPLALKFILYSSTPPARFSAFTISMNHLIAALRPRQWVKNLIVFAPVLFSRHLFSVDGLLRGFSAFLLFCLVSSSCYLINDLRDLEQDRLHPIKRHRPLAAGRLTKRIAIIVAILLMLTAVAGALSLGRTFTVVVGSYWLICLACSFRLPKGEGPYIFFQTGKRDP